MIKKIVYVMLSALAVSAAAIPAASAQSITEQQVMGFDAELWPKVGDGVKR